MVFKYLQFILVYAYFRYQHPLYISHILPITHPSLNIIMMARYTHGNKIIVSMRLTGHLFNDRLIDGWCLMSKRVLRTHSTHVTCWSVPIGLILIFVFSDDVIKWNNFPRYWRDVRGIHRSSVNSPHKGQWRRALKFSFICACTYGWVNNRDAVDLRRHRAHYDVTVMSP